MASNIPQTDDIPNFIKRNSENKSICSFCKCIINSEGGKLIEQHIKGRNHQNKLNKDNKLTETSERYIHVSGIKSIISEDEFIKHFSQFGNIKKHYFPIKKCGFAIVEYKTKTSAKKALYFPSSHMINNCVLKVEKRRNKIPLNNNEKLNRENLLNDNILFELSNIDILYNQANHLYNSVKFIPHKFVIFEQLINNLTSIVKIQSPTASVEIIGSHYYSLAFKNSDLDLTILIETNKDTINLLNEIRSQLIKIYDFKGSLKIIPSKRYPILKVICSNFTCDISVNNRLALRNSQLIKAYFQLGLIFEGTDYSTLFLVAVIAKVWLLSNNICGQNCDQISSYALVLMIIYYFQYQNYLPSLQKPSSMWLNEDIISNFDCFINGWNCTFLDPSYIKYPITKPDFTQTVLGFFKFYAIEFDFKKNVIDIRTQHFQISSRQSLLDELIKIDIASNNVSKFKNHPMVIVDPFELSRNITQNVSRKGFKSFIRVFRYTLNNLSIKEDDAVKIKPNDREKSILRILMPINHVEKPLKLIHMNFKSVYCLNPIETFKIVMKSFISLFLTQFPSKIFFIDGENRSELLNLSELELLVSKFDSIICLKANFLLSTPFSSWYHVRKIRRMKQKVCEDEPVVKHYLDFVCDLKFDIFYNLVQILFNPNNPLDLKDFQNFFSLFKKELKRSFGNNFIVT